MTNYRWLWIIDQWLKEHQLPGKAVSLQETRGEGFVGYHFFVDTAEVRWTWEEWERFVFADRPQGWCKDSMEMDVLVETPEYPKGSRFPPAVAGDRGVSGTWLRNPEDPDWQMGPTYIQFTRWVQTYA
jgi:hypothetical protein